jgi:hypothetical protein
MAILKVTKPGGGSTTPPSSTSTSTSPTRTTTTAPGATQTHYGQCGGNGWTGPTVVCPGLKVPPLVKGRVL